MKWATRIVNRITGCTDATRRPPLGRLLSPRPDDALQDYPSAGLTPSRLTAILQEADAGAPSRALALFEEMEEKDAHLYAVASKRRLAVTGLDWQIVSAAESAPDVDRAMADEAAAYCRETLGRIETFEETLQHLSLAMGRNLALAELVWDRVGSEFGLSDIVPVSFNRIVFDDFGSIRLLTPQSQTDGIELPTNKFIVHTPHSVSGHPARGGLLRVSALVFLGKNLALKDWLIFAEVFGMPVRIARYDPSVTPEEKRELMDMLESLGSNAAGIFSRAVELQFVEAGKGKAPPPYENLVDFLNREMSKAWLGQTLTTETPGLGGSFGATKIHEEVRKDLRDDDVRKEGRTIRRDLLAPIARFKFGNNVPVPHFRRKMDQPRDAQAFTEMLDAAINRLGIQVSRKWVHESLGIPIPANDEPVLKENPRQ